MHFGFTRGRREEPIGAVGRCGQEQRDGERLHARAWRTISTSTARASSRVPHLTQEGDAAAMDAVAGLEAQVESQAVHRGHCRLGRLFSGKATRDQNQRVRMIRIHVPDDSGSRLGQRIRLGAGVLLRLDPPHHAEAADEINGGHFQPLIGEVGVLLPVFRILIAGKVQVADFRRGHFRRSPDQVTRAAPSGSPAVSGCVISRLARAS